MQYKCYKNCKLIFITLPFLSKVKHTRNIINQKKIYSDVKSLSTSLKSLNLEKKGKKIILKAFIWKTIIIVIQ